MTHTLAIFSRDVADTAHSHNISRFILICPFLSKGLYGAHKKLHVINTSPSSENGWRTLLYTSGNCMINRLNFEEE
jgi:hypothetical protein